MKKSWILRKDEEGVSPVIATILMVALTVVLAAILYVLILSLSGSGTTIPPVFGMNLSGDPDNRLWILTAISGGRTVLKNDVYVQLWNETDGFIILTEPLASASGTHGFKYTAASSGDYISVGDIFALSRNYLTGCKLTLVNPDASGQYSALTV
jgi:flagellin-like protein